VQALFIKMPKKSRGGAPGKRAVSAFPGFKGAMSVASAASQSSLAAPDGCGQGAVGDFAGTADADRELAGVAVSTSPSRSSS
jgi:hypothetical protein